MDSFNFIKGLSFTDKNFNAKVLAWLLDPSESHNLGYEFLENFMSLINQKIDKNLNYRVEVNYETTFSTKIDILIESDNSIIAINCGSNCYETKNYKRYFDEILKTKKDVNYIFLCVGNYSCDLDYIKYIRYEELPDILPDNLDRKYQKFIDNYINAVYKKAIDYNIELKTIFWRSLEKQGRMVRQIAKHFNLPIGYKIINEELRTYSIENNDNDVFLIFRCENNSLKLQIRATNKNKEKYKKLVESAKKLKTFTEDKEFVAILDEVELMNKEEKPLDEIIEIIEKSKILENYDKFLKIYNQN